MAMGTGTGSKVLIGICGLLLALTARGETETRPTLRVSLPHLEPLGEYRPDGGMRGLVYELYQALAQEMGVALDARPRPIPRIMNEIRRGDIDATFLVENQRIADVVHPVERLEMTAFSMVFVSPADAPLGSIDALPGRRIGYPRGGGVVFQLVDPAKAELTELIDYHQGTRMLAARRLDALFGARLPLYYAIQQQGLPPDAFAPPLEVKEAPAWFYFSRESSQQALLEPMRQAAARLKANGTFAAIEARYVRCFLDRGECALNGYP